MNKVLYIILISLFSLTVISCAKKSSDDSSSKQTDWCYILGSPETNSSVLLLVLRKR
jgi:hypothetical protein